MSIAGLVADRTGQRYGDWRRGHGLQRQSSTSYWPNCQSNNVYAVVHFQMRD